MNKRQKRKVLKNIDERFQYMMNLNITKVRQCSKTNMQINLMKIVLDERYKPFKDLKKCVDKVIK